MSTCRPRAACGPQENFVRPVNRFNKINPDIKSKRLELNVFSISFNVTPTSAPLKFQLELIILQRDKL